MRNWLSVLTSLGCVSIAATAAEPAQAQTYPSRTVTIVVTAAAGGVTDIVARAIGQRLSEKWGQQIIIENKGGGAHVVGAASVANATPDGHTLMLAEAGTYVINPVLYAKDKLPFDIEKDFIPITGLVRIHHALIASPSASRRTTSPSVIEMAKKKPGELTYGTAGIGSGPHVNMVRFENVAKIKLNAIHYRGATPAMNDVMGGHTNMMLISVSSALPSFRAGKVKMLGIGSAKRLPQVPDVPTIAGGRQLAGLHRRHLVRPRRSPAGRRGRSSTRSTRTCATSWPSRLSRKGSWPSNCTSRWTARRKSSRNTFTTRRRPGPR